MTTESFLVDLLEKNDSLDSLKTWNEKEQQLLYAAAFSLYQQQNYKAALPLFTQLCLSNPFEMDFWKGLASSLQMLLKWKESLHAWGLAALLKDSDPLPHFHAAECFFSLDQKEESLKALLQAEKRLAHNQNADLSSNITLLKELLALR